MEKIIAYKEYSPEKGMELIWEDGFEIKCHVEDGVITISANKEGLISLANHLVNLAQDKVPAGNHIHLDELNSLEDGSSELVIKKK